MLLLVGGIITPHNFFTAATYDHAPSPDELRDRREHAMALMQKGKKVVCFADPDSVSVIDISVFL